MAGESAFLLASVQVPNGEGFVSTAGNSGMTIRTESDAVCFPAASLKSARFLTRFKIPKLQLVAVPARNRLPAVWAYGNTPDLWNLTWKLAEFLASPQVPELERAVQASGQ